MKSHFSQVECDFVMLFTPGQMTAVLGNEGYAGRVVSGLGQYGWCVGFGGNARYGYEKETNYNWNKKQLFTTHGHFFHFPTFGAR